MCSRRGVVIIVFMCILRCSACMLQLWRGDLEGGNMILGVGIEISSFVMGM